MARHRPKQALTPAGIFDAFFGAAILGVLARLVLTSSGDEGFYTLGLLVLACYFTAFYGWYMPNKERYRLPWRVGIQVNLILALLAKPLDGILAAMGSWGTLCQTMYIVAGILLPIAYYFAELDHKRKEREAEQMKSIPRPRSFSQSPFHRLLGSIRSGAEEEQSHGVQG